MILILVIVSGLLFGSFIGAMVWRIHTNKPVAFDRSECEFCHHKLAGKDLIPIFSYLALRGKCRYCGTKISVENPIVELITAGAFAWSYLAWNFNGGLTYLTFGFWLVILIGLIMLAIYDLKWFLLPNVVMYPLIGLALIELIVRFYVGDGFSDIQTYLLAGVLACAFFLILHALGRGRWMGSGDVYLAALIGLLLGTGRTMVGLFIGFGSAALISIILMAARLKTRKDAIPFGPFLIFGLFIAMLYGQTIFNWYVNLFVT